jgi:nitrogen fixation NifU-like protein
VVYTDVVLDHFINPRNVGRIPEADGVGIIGDPSCGDYLKIYVKIEDGRLSDVKFEVCGCPAAIASASVLTEMAKGKTIAEALEMTDIDVAAALGGLPDPKMHCSNLGADALHEAVSEYLKAAGEAPQAEDSSHDEDFKRAAG